MKAPYDIIPISTKRSYVPIRATTTAGLTIVIPGQWRNILGPAIWYAFQAIHTVMTIVGLIFNCLSLIVIYGIVPRLTPPLQLLTSVSFSDMLAPWAIMTLYFPASACQDEIHTSLLLSAHNAGCLTILALAICHNIATFRPLNYEKIMSQTRLWITINSIWAIAVITGNMHFLTSLIRRNREYHYCMQVLHSTNISVTISFAMMGLTILVTVFVYARVLLHLRPIHHFADEVEPRKSTRGVFTGIFLAATFFTSWLPYLITKYVQVEASLWENYSALISVTITQIFILLHSISDPAIYGSRMTMMQTGYLTLYHKCRGWVVRTWRSIAKHTGNDEIPSTPLNPIESIC